MTDLYTKWVAAAPLTSKTASGVAAALVKIMFHYGIVRKIITDQGKEFVNEVRSFLTVLTLLFNTILLIVDGGLFPAFILLLYKIIFQY